MGARCGNRLRVGQRCAVAGTSARVGRQVPPRHPARAAAAAVRAHRRPTAQHERRTAPTRPRHCRCTKRVGPRRVQRAATDKRRRSPIPRPRAAVIWRRAASPAPSKTQKNLTRRYISRHRRRGSNPRSSAPEADAFPLGHADRQMASIGAPWTVQVGRAVSNFKYCRAKIQAAK